MDSPSSNIKVVLRVRPPNKHEVDMQSAVVVQPVDENMLIFDPPEKTSPEFFRRRSMTQRRDLLKRTCKDMRFAFDRVFDDETSTDEVFNHTTKDIIDGVLHGFNCSVFAYGATGAGKTHTMLGSPENPGIIFRTMMELYSRIDAVKEDKTCTVAVSYLEVYNEQICDLLKPQGYLPIREDPQDGPVISGLSLHKPSSAEELLQLLSFGNQNRTQHPTDANSESSRSHAVFQVFIRQSDRTANISTPVRVAKMSMIDLAGSERATVTTNRGDRFREGANINRSLLALGNCINALADGKKHSYIPYRNSKLTRLLKDSLGGNCRTVMIAAVSPSMLSYEDTYNTLKYANRAKNIKATVKSNVVNVDLHVTRYTKIINELHTEDRSCSEIRPIQHAIAKKEWCLLSCGLHIVETMVSELKQNLARQIDAAPPIVTKPDTDYKPYLNKLYGVHQERLSVRQELLELESVQKSQSIHIKLKQRSLKRIDMLIPDGQLKEQAVDRMNRSIHGASKRISGIDRRKQPVLDRLNTNSTWMMNVATECKHAGNDDDMPEVLDYCTQMHGLGIELRDSQRHVKYLKRLCRVQEREAQSNERLICSLLRMVRMQYFLLKSNNVLEPSVSQDYQNLQHQITGSQGVSSKSIIWADQTLADLDNTMATTSYSGMDTITDQSLMDATIGQSTADTTTGDASARQAMAEFNRLMDFPTIRMQSAVSKTPRGRKSYGGGTPICIAKKTSRPGIAITPTAPLPIPRLEFTSLSAVGKPGNASNTLDNVDTPGCPGKTLDAGSTPYHSANEGCVDKETLHDKFSQRPTNTVNPKEDFKREKEPILNLTRQIACLVPSEIEPDTVAPVNETYILEDDGVAPLVNSPPNNVLPKMGGNSTYILNADRQKVETVKESVAPICAKLPPKKPARINTATVVKTAKRPSPTHEQNRHPTHAKRSMTFKDSSPVKKGAMTFADALKSPGHTAHVKRSPLIAINNIAPQNTVSKALPVDEKPKIFPRKLPKVNHTPNSHATPKQIPSQLSVHNSKHTPSGIKLKRSSVKLKRSQSAVSALPERYSVLSLIKQREGLSHASSTHHTHTPSYMKGTKSSSRRRWSHRRSMSTESKPQVDENGVLIERPRSAHKPLLRSKSSVSTRKATFV